MRDITRKSSGWLTPTVYAFVLLSAAFGAPIVFAVAVALTYVVEPRLKTYAPAVNRMYTRVAFGLSVRYALRDLALVVLVARLHAVTSVEIAGVTGCVAVLIGSRASLKWLRQRTADRRILPILTRNVDLSALRIPDAPPAWLTNSDDVPMLVASGVPLAGVVTAAIIASPLPVLIAAIVAALGAIGVVAAAVQPARRAGRIKASKTVLAEARRQIQTYAPEVIIYFSGTPTSIYQLNMWLPVAARLRQRTVIVMRQRANMRVLAATSLPVVCLPDPVDLMHFQMPTMRVVLYPTHVGQNIHYLRMPGISHVFVCHGESDKLASVNPYAKAYDEVWVAGLAARERYALADVGVRDEDIVEVGGPQLAMIQHPARTSSALPDREGLTVLYAPTWEGWMDDPQNTSVIKAGPDIIARLLAHPGVAKVIYKPHPLTGTRTPSAARSSKKIIALLSGETSGAAPSRAEIDAALAGATALNRPGVDEAQAARDDGTLPADCAGQIAQATARWSEVFWSSGADRVVVTGPLPDLFGCFNACDVLIADISGVIADFLVSGKPYIVTNSSGLDTDAFRAKYPTTRGAYVIRPANDKLANDKLASDKLASEEPAGSDLDGILTELHAGADPMAEERHKLKVHMLGEDGADERFQDAVDRLVDRTTERMIRRGDIQRA